MKIRPLGAELFHADRRTDMTKLIVAFRNYANAPNNTWNSQYVCGFGYYQRPYVFQKILFWEFLVQWVMLLRCWVSSGPGGVWNCVVTATGSVSGRWQHIRREFQPGNVSKVGLWGVQSWGWKLDAAGSHYWHTASLVLTVLNIGCTFLKFYFLQLARSIGLKSV